MNWRVQYKHRYGLRRSEQELFAFFDTFGPEGDSTWSTALKTRMLLHIWPSFLTFSFSEVNAFVFEFTTEVTEEWHVDGAGIYIWVDCISWIYDGRLSITLEFAETPGKKLEFCESIIEELKFDSELHFKKEDVSPKFVELENSRPPFSVHEFASPYLKAVFLGSFGND